MTKSIILINTDLLHKLNQAIGNNSIYTNSDVIFDLQPGGNWKQRGIYLKNPWTEIPLDRGDLVDVFMDIVTRTSTNIDGPRTITPPCTCPIQCDCAAPKLGLKSMYCPVHNDQPDPDPECPRHKL